MISTNVEINGVIWFHLHSLPLDGGKELRVYYNPDTGRTVTRTFDKNGHHIGGTSAELEA